MTPLSDLLAQVPFRQGSLSELASSTVIASTSFKSGEVDFRGSQLDGVFIEPDQLKGTTVDPSQLISLAELLGLNVSQPPTEDS